MTPSQARAAVRRYAERYKINFEWLAKKVGANSRTVVRNWIVEGQEPRDELTWVRMAEALGLYAPASERLIDLAHDLAIAVLEKTDDPQLKHMAVLVVKESRQ